MDSHQRLTVAFTVVFAVLAIFAPLPADGQQAAPTRWTFSGEGLRAAGDAAVDEDHNERNVHVPDGWSWRVTGNNVRLQFGRVSNDSSDRTTGTLYAMLALSERDDLHQRRTVRYHEAARVRLGELRPGRSFRSFDMQVEFTPPPAGTYWGYLVILEYDPDNPNWETLWITSQRSRQTATFEDPGPQISISSWSWTETGNNVRLQIGRVSNDSNTRTTRTLYAMLAFSERDDLHQQGRTGRYYEAARVRLGELRPGGSFRSIDRQVEFARPPAGTYWTYIAILEYDSGNSNWERLWITSGRSRSSVTLDDPDPQISLSAARVVSEGDEVQITATADRPVDRTTRITLERVERESSASSNDYTVGDIVIRSGQRQGETTLSARMDSRTEGDETLTLEGRWSGNSTSNRLTITIEDAEAPTELSIRLSAADTTLTEGQSIWLTATADRPATEDLTITVRRVGGTAGNDDFGVGDIVIESGQTEGRGVLSVWEDGVPESAETLTLQGRWSGGDTTRATFTIYDAAVPALPAVGALLLACGLYVMGRRKMQRR